MFKKSSLALAVAGFAFAGSAMAAPSVNLYGRIDLGVEYYADEDGVNAHLYPNSRNSDERDFTMSNGNPSRLGVKGDMTLDSGATMAYQYEMSLDVLTGGAATGTRHAWLSMAKGPHTLKVGTQDNYLLLYGGLNAQISEVHGFGAYYYTSNGMPGSRSGTFRTNSSISYTFGGGAFSGDAFTATIAAHIAEDGRQFTDANDDDMDANSASITGFTAGAEATFGTFTLTGAYQASMVTESDAYKAYNKSVKGTAAYMGDLTAPSIIQLGGRLAVMDGFNLGLNYSLLDKDTDEDSGRAAMVLGGDFQVTEKVNLHAGFGVGADEDDFARQMDSNLFAQIIYATSDSSHVRLELEQISYSSDTKALEGDTMVALVSLRQNF